MRTTFKKIQFDFFFWRGWIVLSIFFRSSSSKCLRVQVSEMSEMRDWVVKVFIYQVSGGIRHVKFLTKDNYSFFSLVLRETFCLEREREAAMSDSWLDYNFYNCI